MPLLSDIAERKFVETIALSGWEVWTDTGWKPITQLHVTVPYEVWRVTAETGRALECADDHILFDAAGRETYAKDCGVGTTVMTEDGPERVASLERTGAFENMFDLSVDSPEHRLYTGGFLSHNTEATAAFLLWWACFKSKQLVFIASRIGSDASETIYRIKTMYDELAWWIKPGLVTDNVMSLKFDNGSRIVASTTTPNTGRGRPIQLLYLDEFAYVAPGIQDRFYESIQPTLANGGRLIITSTPNTDEDKFALIWFNAADCENGAWSDGPKWARERPDDVEEYETIYEPGAPGEYEPTGEKREKVIEGFKRFYVEWNEHPKRDEGFKRKMLADPAVTYAVWQRQYECLSGDNVVTIRKNGIVRKMTMRELHEMVA